MSVEGKTASGDVQLASDEPVADAPTQNGDGKEEEVVEQFVDRDRRLLAAMPTNEDSVLRDLKAFWKPLKDDPYDFNGWTQLLQYVDAGVRQRSNIFQGKQSFRTQSSPIVVNC